MNSDPRVMEFFPALLAREESDALADHVERHFEEHGFGPFAVEVRGGPAFIGFVGFLVPTFEAHFTPCVEIGWRLASGWWGQGMATEAAHAVVRYGFAELGLAQLVSMTPEGNQRSRRVMEKLGMRRDHRDDFDHPKLAEEHPLRRHVLYRLNRGV